ncbi:unnamed protein product [Spirodela intermedia]|uniref:Uncharacterized protein n=1 Tax=Spirodela intermedia TaxID=51605 RepID=A0ABN7EDK9_SPIIN|nr:unnamed protein product [Spirodela intermedia]
MEMGRRLCLPKMGNTVAEIFSVLTPGIRSHATTGRKARGVDYELVLGKIIIDAMNSGVAKGKEEEPADLKAPTSLYSLFRC